MVGADVPPDPRRQRHGRHARDATAQLEQHRSPRGAGSMGRIATGDQRRNAAESGARPARTQRGVQQRGGLGDG